MTNIIAQVPPVIEAMTGIKLTDLMKNVPGLSQPLIEVQPVGNGSATTVPAITPESLVAVVDSPVVTPVDKKSTGEK